MKCRRHNKIKKNIMKLNVTCILLVGVVLFVCCTSCQPSGRPDNTVDDTTKKVERLDNSQYDVVEIDSCEYIVCQSVGGTQTMVHYSPICIHKGNCRHCAARRKAELEAIIGQKR